MTPPVTQSIAEMVFENDYAALLASAPRPMTADWLRSPAYDALMQRHVPAGGPGLHEAQEQSRSYVFRHATAASALGVWRWRGMPGVRDLLIAAAGNIIDFGGAAAPLGLGAMVVDTAPRDAHGQAVLVSSLTYCKAPLIFTSHTLEHVPDLDATLEQITSALMPRGTLIAHVPAWTCERWRAGVHTSSEHGAHRWTFTLAGEGIDTMHVWHNTSINARIGNFLTVERAYYCGDDSIMVVARR